MPTTTVRRAKRKQRPDPRTPAVSTSASVLRFLSSRSDRCLTGAVCCAAVFYLEACLFAQICENSDELFSVGVLEPFRCKFSRSRFAELQRKLTQGPRIPSDAKGCTGDTH